MEKYTSANQDYWQMAIAALSCILRYKRVDDDDEKAYRIRYQDFPEAITNARLAYSGCEHAFYDTFRMSNEDADEWFSQLVVNETHLKACYDQAIQGYDQAAPAVPLRLL